MGWREGMGWVETTWGELIGGVACIMGRSPVGVPY